LVGDLSQVEPVDLGEPLAPAAQAWTTKDRSRVGHIGDPRAASAEKGEALFRVFSDDAVAWLERVIAWDGGAAAERFLRQ
jgi:creatinine amidohydrolase